MVSSRRVTDLHDIHPYPARFPGSLAATLIAEELSGPSVVLDPFCGCGTTLVEAVLAGHEAIGVDMNPVATLISQAKVTALSAAEARLIESYARSVEAVMAHHGFVRNGQLTIGPPVEPDLEVVGLEPVTPDYPALRHWFDDDVIHELGLLRALMDRFPVGRLRPVFQVAFSSIIVRVSRQESDTRYAAVDKTQSEGLATELFVQRLVEIVGLLRSTYATLPHPLKASVIKADTRQLSKLLPESSVDFVLTSPPYANSYDYYLYHKHRMLWLGYDYVPVMEAEIGSRREFSSLKAPSEKFSADLVDCFLAVRRVMREGARAVVLIGDSRVRGGWLNGAEVMEEVGARVGLRFESARSVQLDDISRSFNKSFRLKGKREHTVSLVAC